MIFDEESQAVDWILRYGNEALAEIEGVPLDKMTGRTEGVEKFNCRTSLCCDCVSKCRIKGVRHVFFICACYCTIRPKSIDKENGKYYTIIDRMPFVNFYRSIVKHKTLDRNGFFAH